MSDATKQAADEQRRETRKFRAIGIPVRSAGSSPRMWEFEADEGDDPMEMDLAAENAFRNAFPEESGSWESVRYEPVGEEG